MKSIKKILSICTISLLLSGCLYPAEKKVENQTPYKEQIQSVQSAVDQFQSDQAVLPILTKENDTPIYQKYVIDFRKITPRYMAEAPGNSYEAGGVFQYVLVDVEDNPTVKLIDVRMAQQIQELMIRITLYRQSNGYPPFGERISDYVYALNYEKLGMKEAPTVTSPYSQKPLQIVIDTNGELFVDYTPDLYDALQADAENYKPGEDIRNLLVKNSEFVPAFSLPYTYDAESKVPIFLTK